MKHLKYFEAYISPEEERLNDVLDKMLDKGKDYLTSDDFEILRNRGELPQTKKYVGIPNRLEFELEKVENEGDALKVFGTLLYKKQKFYGWFTIPIIDERRGQNYWDFLKITQDIQEKIDKLNIEKDKFIQKAKPYTDNNEDAPQNIIDKVTQIEDNIQKLTRKLHSNVEFDPDPDDLYELDSMIQEIEYDFVGD